MFITPSRLTVPSGAALAGSAAPGQAARAMAAYKARLGITGHACPTLNQLRDIQRRHIESFSWDTFDLALPVRPIVLDAETIIDRFMTEQRGGLCFELNGAFCHLLNQLGLRAWLASAFVHGHENRRFDFDMDTHAVVIADIAGTLYLVDVGWPDSYREPVPLHCADEYADRSGRYRLVALEGQTRYRMDMHCAGDWRSQYSFGTTPCDLAHFQATIERMRTSERYGVYRQLNCIKPHADGCLSVRDGQLLRRMNDQCLREGLAGQGRTLTEVLKQDFGMHSAFVDRYLSAAGKGGSLRSTSA